MKPELLSQWILMCQPDYLSTLLYQHLVSHFKSNIFIVMIHTYTACCLGLCPVWVLFYSPRYGTFLIGLCIFTIYFFIGLFNNSQIKINVWILTCNSNASWLCIFQRFDMSGQFCHIAHSLSFLIVSLLTDLGCTPHIYLSIHQAASLQDGWYWD